MTNFLKILFLQWWVCLGVIAQVPLNVSLGNFKKVEISGSAYTFTTDFGKARVEVYSSDVIRIRVEKQNFTKTFSYAVVANPEPCPVKTHDSVDSYSIETDSLTLKVQKKPLRFIFLTKNGTVINSDDLAFGTSWLGDEATTYKTLQKNERFIGLGEQTGNLDRRGEAYFNYNSDDPTYNNGTKNMYSSIPFYIGLHSGLCYGIFLDNSSKTTFNFGAGNNRFSSFAADCGEMNYYFIYHTNIPKIIESYTWLTGRMPLPPVWSLGYQQCRYSYFPDADVISTAQKFRERNIPADMIYLDIHYMDQYKLFTWDKQRFPDPKAMIGDLKKLSFHLAVIIDPGVKVEKDYSVYDDGLKSDIFIKYPDGTYYQGNVWPGWCNFPDFTMPKAREWWGNQIKLFADQGVTGYWNDMNEIAAWGKEVPKLLELNWEGKQTTYKEGKNVYGMLMARSSYEGAKKYMNGKRPFVLTRSGYAGLQRYTAIWTGDNQSYDDHMFLGVRLLNSLGMSGVSFAGMDIGGFSGNPTPNLYTRWMQIGAFVPMFRGHTSFYTNHNEPWSFGENFEDIVRRYIGFRYQLMPYLYSNFYESTQDGMPVMRSLAINYPYDSLIYDADFQQQFLFGPSILVAPVKGYDALTKLYLPQGKWFDLFNDKVYDGKQTLLTETPLDKLPLFVKAGSIVPMQKLVETTAENPGDTLFVHIYAGEQGSQFVYFEDDGETYDYSKGAIYKRSIIYHPENMSIEFEKKEGNLSSRFKVVTMIMHGFQPSELAKLQVNGTSTNISALNIRFFTSHFKFADYGPFDYKEVIEFSIQNTDDKIAINW